MYGIGPNPGSNTYRFIAFNAANQVYNGTTYENWTDAHIATYLITVIQQGSTNNYTGSLPTGAVRWQMWLWTGTLSTSYPVWDSDQESLLSTTTSSVVPVYQNYISNALVSVPIICRDDNGNPLIRAEGYITSDSAGNTLVAGTFLTDWTGTFTTFLTPGVTYYLWLNGQGLTPIKGQAFVAG